MSRLDVQPLPKKEVEGYRGIDRLSYSALKMYNDSRLKFWKKYIMKEQLEEDDSDDIRAGNIVDVLLTDSRNAHKYFNITSASKPTGQLLTFVEFLFKFTMEDTKEGVVSTSLQSRMEKAYEAVKEGNGGKLRDSLGNFIVRFNNEALEFFTEKLNSIGKIVLTAEEADLYKNIEKKLRNSENTKQIFEAEGLSKFPILFELNGEEFKMEADRIVFDHKEKIIYPYDLKVTNFVEDFLFNSFLKRKYYIQSSLYKFGIMSWCLTNEYKDYKVENLAFIAADQTNFLDPIIYRTTDKHYEQGFEGFKFGNTQYRGIMQILEDIKTSKETNVWSMSAYNIRNKGVTFLPEFKNFDE